MEKSLILEQLISYSLKNQQLLLMRRPGRRVYTYHRLQCLFKATQEKGTTSNANQITRDRCEKT